MMHDDVVLECTPKGTSKATGIDWLCKYLGIAKEDTYGIGDSINDLDMLQYVGHGIAMGNGTQVAKEAAEYVTTDIHEDGIYNALKHYRLIQYRVYKHLRNLQTLEFTGKETNYQHSFKKSANFMLTFVFSSNIILSRAIS